MTLIIYRMPRIVQRGTAVVNRNITGRVHPQQQCRSGNLRCDARCQVP